MGRTGFVKLHCTSGLAQTFLYQKSYRPRKGHICEFFKTDLSRKLPSQSWDFEFNRSGCAQFFPSISNDPKKNHIFDLLIVLFSKTYHSKSGCWIQSKEQVEEAPLYQRLFPFFYMKVMALGKKNKFQSLKSDSAALKVGFHSLQNPKRSKIGFWNKLAQLSEIHSRFNSFKWTLLKNCRLVNNCVKYSAL